MSKVKFFLEQPKQVEFEAKRPMIVEESKVHSNDTENDPQAPSHILNRPFYSETVTEPFEIKWDGAWGGRDVLMLEEGVVFVRVSDRVFTVGELEGCFVTANGVFGEDTFQPTSQEMEVEGYKAIALLYNNIPFVLINPEDVYDAEIGISAPKGTWFLKASSDDSYAFISSLQFPSLTYEKIYKLGNKFVDSEWMATTKIGTGKKVFKAQNFFEAMMAGTIVEDNFLQLDTRFYTAEELSKATLTMTFEDMELTLAAASAFGSVVEGVSAVVAEFSVLSDGTVFQLVSIEQNVDTVEKGLYISVFTLGIMEATDITLTINGVSGLAVPNKLPNKFLDLDWIPKSKVVPREVFSGVPSDTSNIDYIPALSDPNTIVAMEMDGIVHEVAASRLFGFLWWGVSNSLTGHYVFLYCAEKTCYLSANTTTPITVTVYENVADQIPSYFLPEGVGSSVVVKINRPINQGLPGYTEEIVKAWSSGSRVILEFSDYSVSLLAMNKVVDGIYALGIELYGNRLYRFDPLAADGWVLTLSGARVDVPPQIYYRAAGSLEFVPTFLNSTLTEGSTLPAQEGAVFTAIQGLQDTIGTLNQDLENRLNGGT